MTSDSANFSNYRQILDPVGKLSLSGTTKTWKAHKMKDWRTDPPHQCKKCQWILAHFLAPCSMNSAKNHLFPGVSKGRHSSCSSLDTFYLNICLMVCFFKKNNLFFKFSKFWTLILSF